METKVFDFKTNYYSANNKLILESHQITLLENNEIISQIKSEDIDAYRFGIAWITGAVFSIGRLYKIDIRSKNNIDTIKIRLRTVYGVRKYILDEKYNQILDALFNIYWNDVIKSFLDKIDIGENITVCNILINKNGVHFDKGRNNHFISWEDIDSRIYHDYYSISSKKNPHCYITFTFLDDWNAGIIYSVTRGILLQKNLINEHDII